VHQYPQNFLLGRIKVCLFVTAHLNVRRVKCYDSNPLENLEDMIASYEQALTLLPSGHPTRSIFLDGLANAVLTRYDQSGRMEDLDEVITYYRGTLTLRPIGHPYRSGSLLNLANVIFARYQRLGRMEDVDEVIKYNSEILTLCPLNHPYHSVSLNNLAGTVLIRYEQSGRIEDLEHAIIYNRQALNFRPAGHSGRSSSLLSLAKAVFARYQKLGRKEDLEEMITHNFQALLLSPPGHRHHPISLSNLAAAFLTRYQQSGGIEDLENAITYNRKALSFHPSGHPNHSISLDSLACALLLRYEQSGRMEDLEDAIASNRKALDLRPPDHPLRSSSLNNLANAVLTRFKQSGNMEDLKVAITYNSEALNLRPFGHPDRSSSLISLGNAVVTRYQQLGGKEHLEEAIAYYRQALDLQALGHPDRPASLNNLANVVSCRFERLGRMEDLEYAITCNRDALALRPSGHPDRCSSLINFANAVFRRYGQLSSMEDLEQAITYYDEALTLTLRSIGHPLHASSLNNVANAVLARYQHSHMKEDLKKAMEYYLKALALRPSGHPDRSSSLNNIAYAVFTHYQQSGRVEDLEKAITYYREALKLCPCGRPNRFIPLANLADAVLSRFCQSTTLKDLDESITLYKQAVHNSAASSKDRLAIAIRWAHAAQQHRHKSVIDAYSMSLQCLDRCLISYPDVDSQQRFLATVDISLASNAASAAIDAKNLKAAVELLDQGRALLWSKMAGYRYPLDQLRKVDKELADQFGTLSVQLEHLALPSELSGPMNSGIPMSSTHSTVKMQRYHDLSEKWDKMLKQIQNLDGFSNFLQAVPFDTLQTAAAANPIILVNISEYRSDAIILHINKPPILVSLPNVHPGDLTDLSKQLALAQRPDTTNASKLILPILRDLWNDIVSPVCECLTRLAVPRMSRVWWCPTSKLCALPLHAAGPYQPEKRNLPDIYISSYIPTISALISARSNMVGQSIIPKKLLLIGQPGETLLNVQDEIDNIRQLGDFVDVIVGIDASRDAVLRGLQGHSWAHFACHGRLGDNSQPFQASFELDGGSRLTLLDLIRARLPNAELAFLSACHSAAGDPGTPDETIHLAAALQFCGFRSVVGTMWAMEDRDGPTISKEFYQCMIHIGGGEMDFRDSAKALNVAIRAMRRNGVPLERWIMFVHIGA
jgi:tetratricopeptide (TPR) repeat protein/CHAT domain-containing protein